MGQVLYRKYRSRSLGEIVGQEHITTTLKNALKAGKISHAYLFTGPRGTGKTSIARILAHEINNLPYSEETHFDIIEIDAASNNSVDDIRELREKVQSAPTSAKYKVYIIDEVHMLSKQAFNALLKTLEEPPEHVVFILATTEAHKLPETIVSRTQRYSFRPVPLEQVVDHLKHIAHEEKIEADDEALRLIAEHGEGSFRDSISLLDQVSSLDSSVTVANVERLLGRAPSSLIDEALTMLTTHNASGVTATLRELYDKGYEPAMISLQLGKRLRAELGAQQTTLTVDDIMSLLHELLAVPASHRPAQLLELTLLGYALKSKLGAASGQTVEPKQIQAQPAEIQPPPQAMVATKPALASKLPAEKHDSPARAFVSKPAPTTQPEQTKTTNAVEQGNHTDADDSTQSTISSTVSDTIDVAELWQQVLQTVKQTHNTLYGIARMAKPTLSGDTLTLVTKFPFHQKRLSETKNRDILASSISAVRGIKTALVCTVIDTSGSTTESEGAAKPDVTAISNIFGGAELLN